MEESARPVDKKSSALIRLGEKQKSLNSLDDIIRLLNDHHLVSQLNENSIGDILLFVKEYLSSAKQDQWRHYIADNLIEKLLDKEELRKKLTLSHIVIITNLNLKAADRLACYDDIFNKYAPNIIFELATNLTYKQNSFLTELLSVMLIHKNLCGELSADILLKVIENTADLALLDKILANKKVREKLNANSIIKIMDLNIYYPLTIAQHEDLCLKLPPTIILILVGSPFFTGSFSHYPSVIELWLSGAKDAVKQEAEDQQRFVKAKGFLKKLENIYLHRLKDASFSEVSSIKKTFRSQLVDLIKNSGLSKEQSDELFTGVEKDSKSVIYYRHILPNSFSKFFTTQTALDFRNEFKQRYQEAKPISESKNDKDIELNKVTSIDLTIK